MQHSSFPAVKLTPRFTFVTIGCFADTMDPIPVCAVCETFWICNRGSQTTQLAVWSFAVLQVPWYASVRRNAQKYGPDDTELSWPAGRLLQSSASQKCPKCRQPLETVNVSNLLRTFDLVDMTDNHRQQQQQQLHEAVLCSKICPEDLQITNDVIGWGAAGVVRRGALTFRGSQLKVSFQGKVMSEESCTSMTNQFHFAATLDRGSCIYRWLSRCCQHMVPLLQKHAALSKRSTTRPMQPRQIHKLSECLHIAPKTNKCAW